MRVKKQNLLLELTERELLILKYLSKGLENREIADKIFVSTHTVKAHITSILRKLKARNRTEAVYIALKKGIID